MKTICVCLAFAICLLIKSHAAEPEALKKLEDLLHKANAAFEVSQYSLAEGYYEALNQSLQENESHRGAVIQLSTHPAHSYSLQGWAQYRMTDSQWRSRFHNGIVDASTLRKTRQRFESQIQSLETADPENNDLIAALYESLGDTFWIIPPAADVEKAWQAYEQSLRHWGSSIHLDEARKQYFDILQKASLPSGTKQQLNIPIGKIYFENAVKIAQNNEESAFGYWGLAKAYTQEDSSADLHTLAGLHFEKAIELGQNTPWIGQAFFDYAEWAEKGGGLHIDGRVKVPVEPNLNLAEILYTQSLQFLNPQHPSALWAYQALQRLKRGSLQIILNHEIPARSPFEFRVKAHQIEQIDFSLYLLDLDKDIDFNQYALKHALLNDTSNTRPHDPARQWLSAIDTNDKLPFSTFQKSIEIDSYDPEKEITLTWPTTLPIGMYLLEAHAKDHTERHLLVVGDLRLIANATGNSFWVYAYENLTNQPSSNTTIILNTWSSGGDEDPGVWTKQTGRTDASGKATFSLTTGMDVKAYVITAQNQEGKTAFVVEHQLLPYQGQPSIEIKTICDSKAYKAGQTVHWKFFIDNNRNKEIGALQGPITYTIKDPLDNILQKGAISNDSLLGAEGELEIKSAFLQGPYCLTIQNAVGKLICDKKFLFTVEKFRKAEVEVFFETQYKDKKARPSDIFMPGEEICIKTTAKSRAGAPLGGSLVQLKIYQAPFSTLENPSIGQIIETRVLQTNDLGELLWTFIPPEHPSDFLYTFVLDFPGLAATEAAFHKRIGVKQDMYHATLSSPTPIIEPGKELLLELKTTDPWGHPVARTGHLTVTRKDHTEPIVEIPLATNSHGYATYTLQVQETNLYEALWIDDDSDHPFSSSISLWMLPQGPWENDMEFDFDLHFPESLPYKAQQVPIVLTLPEACGTLMITIAKEHLFHWEKLDPAQTVYRLDLPLPNTWSPEVTLEAIWIDNNHLQSLQRNIKVTQPLENYEVEWQWDKDAYHPNETALLTLKLTEHQIPIANADITLTIDNLKDVTCFSPFVSQRSFRKPPDLPMACRLATSIQILESESPDTSKFFIPQEQFLHIQEPSPLLSGEEKWIRTLTHQPLTLVWKKNLTTDANGMLRLPIAVPNEIHQWSGKALLNVGAHCFECDLPDLHMHKEITGKLLAPDFLVEGDQWEFYIEIHNLSNHPAPIEVDLMIKGAEPLAPTTSQRIQFAHNYEPGISQHSFSLKAGSEESLSIEGTLQTENYTQKIDIKRPIILLQDNKKTYTCLTTTQNTLTLPASIDTAHYYFLRDWNRFFNETTLSQDNLHKLSTESIMSQLIVDIVAYDWLQKDIRPSVLEERWIRAQKGVKKILKAQNRDGGWPWWPEGPSDLQLTAHMTALLTLASQLKIVDIPEKCLQQARNYLENSIQLLADPLVQNPTGKNTNLYEGITVSRKDHNNLLESLVFWALTCQYSENNAHPKRQETDLFSKLWKKRDHLSFISLCVLTLGALQAGFEEEAVLLSHRLERTIDSQSIKEPIRTFYPKPDPYYTLGDQAAFALLSILQAAPESSDTQLCAFNTLLQERQGLDWEFHRTTALALIGIYKYLKKNPQREPNTLALSLDNNPISMPAEGPLKILNPPLEKKSLKVECTSGSLPLIVWKETSHKHQMNSQRIPHDLLAIERYYDHIWLQPSLLEGFIEHKRRLELFDTVRSGDQIEVVLILEVREPMTHLLIKDPLPAGFECVYPSSFDPLEARGVLSSQIQTLRNGIKTGFKPIYTNKKRTVLQARDQESLISAIDQLAPGFWEIRYRLRAEACGRFQVLPATLQAEYAPAYWTQTSKNELVVQD